MGIPQQRPKKERKSVGMHHQSSLQESAVRNKMNITAAQRMPNDNIAGSSNVARCKSPVNRVKMRYPAPQPNKSPILAGSLKPNNHRLYNPNLNASFNVAEHRYGTPGSNSALSSQYSSQEQINELFNELRINSGGRHVYDVGEGSQDANDETIHRLGGFRPRSRSLSSPVCFMSEISGDIPLMSTVFKERFPKAKSHMEELLMAFIQENVPLSGLISSVDMTSLNMEPMMRNLSPSFSRSVHCETPIPELSSTPVNRQFNNQVNRSSFNTSYSSSINSIVSNRRSVIVTASESLAGDPTVINLVSDGATRFIHHQIVEIASDILQKSKDDVITSNYFVEMTCRLEGTLDEAKVKVSDESYHYLTRVVRELLMVISRPARLLECLEFDPGDFYQLLEEAEGVVRNEMSETQEKTHDMPQYILGKLGLDKKINEGHLEDRFSMKSVNGDQVCDGKKNIAPDKPKNNITPCETDFDSLRLISNGAYGAVYLVRHKVTRQRFALKKMKKQTLILRNQVDQVYAERDILTFTDNPFVVSFFGSFETKTYLCMLLEYVEGGDCASLLKSAVVLPLELARLYIAETILAIEYLHSYGIVHRDLKPDNLLITAMGHIKLTDFGLSKIGLMNRTTLASEAGPDDTHQFKDMQLCGTPDYIAPEVIIRQGYGKPVDWWALGIMLYEFLVGCVPFCGDTPDCLFANIIKDDPEFPEGDEGLDSDGENLIKALLEKNPNDRIGTYGGAVQVSSHAFFSSLNFNTLLRQKAEFVPNLEGEDDTSYFDTRCDRYNHEPDSGDEENSPMFCTFNTATPRHSICAIEIPFVSTSNPSGSCVTLPSIVNSSSSQACDTSFFPSDFTSKAEKVNENEYDYETSSNISMLSEDSSVGKMHFKSDKSLNIGEASTKCLKSTLSAETPDSLPSPTAVILRKKFSAQRHLNSSTSSGSTNYTGCVGTTTSSTDSSVDASNFTLTENSGAGLAHYYRKSSPLTSPLPRFSVSNYSSPLQIGTPENVNSIVGAELSPVAEVLTVSGKREMICEDIKNISATSPSQIAKSAVSLKVSPGKKRSPNTDSEFFDETLKVVIPTTLSNTPVQSCSYQTACQLSPGAGSVSSASSFDSNSPNISKIKDDCCAAAGTSYLQPNSSTLPPSTPSPLHGKGRTVTIKKGPRGYGFTVRSVRVYVDIILEFYRIEHIIDTVIEDSPAELAGLVTEEFITHVNNMPVRNLTHPDLQRRLLNSDNEIHLRVLPMSQSSIREVPGRREVGQMIKKLSKKTSKHSKLEKKTRKPSSLFRRLSGKRGTNDIVPGSSTQKQTFMPRSVSSQDGILLTNNQPKASTTLQPTEELWQKEKITESTPLYTKTISSVETLTGSIIAVSSEENSKNSSPKTKSFQKEIPSIMKTSATIEPISKIIHKEMPPITEGHKLETPKPSTKPEPTGIVGQLGYLLGNKDRFKPFQQQTKSLPIPPTNPSTIPTPANESYISRLKRSPNATRRLSAAKLVVNRFLKNNTDNT
uniref:Non-specific serine/threonine protein kinase n=1 Tax=Rhabditophanes sp. KR3021 TaxID=114890 RepID=A0AC35U4L1_9BILA